MYRNIARDLNKMSQLLIDQISNVNEGLQNLRWEKLDENLKTALAELAQNLGQVIRMDIDRAKERCS